MARNGTEVTPQRTFTAIEFRALTPASGRFECVAEFGALDGSIPFRNNASATRMVPVLRRV
jgi:hypothetical protein